MMIDVGANVNLAGFTALTPLAYARINGQGAIIGLLKSTGAR